VLHVAAEAGHLPVVCSLLHAGADPDDVDEVTPTLHAPTDSHCMCTTSHCLCSKQQSLPRFTFYSGVCSHHPTAAAAAAAAAAAVAAAAESCTCLPRLVLCNVRASTLNSLQHCVLLPATAGGAAVKP
jgi:hypothetical protein